MSIYRSLGVTPIINATGTFTRLGGSLMPREVIDAMNEAAREFVCLDDLQYRAGNLIAELLGAEAAYVVSGCYAGVVLSIAACLTGLDPAKMDRLPRTDGMEREVVMLKLQRNSYDHALEVAGGTILEAGDADGCTIQELESAIGADTAAIFFLPEWTGTTMSIAEVVAIGKRRHTPVVVDAAGRLDNPHNLKAYIAQKPDLICFSGGKHIRGPQASGFVCGRRDLISAIAFQHLDMDFTPEVYTAPRELLPIEALPFMPRQGIGRGFKAGKEEIVGLLTALRLFVQRDHAAERARMERQVQAIADGLAAVPFVQTEIVGADARPAPIPLARVAIDEQALEM
ncbi:MAG: aminotransferase class V-fold PLP-dependent enzyme, partial [Chloroflexi bacterium]|nr:aminotransferase class V-fold PLP-dependent enzyme [Chloroflexota bacterium]